MLACSLQLTRRLVLSTATIYLFDSYLCICSALGASYWTDKLCSIKVQGRGTGRYICQVAPPCRLNEVIKGDRDTFYQARLIIQKVFWKFNNKKQSQCLFLVARLLWASPLRGPKTPPW